VALGHLARANLDLGNQPVAAEQFRGALPILEEHMPQHMVLPMVLNGYGRLLLERNDADGRRYIDKALMLMDAVGGGERLFKLQEWAGAPPPTRTARVTVVKTPAKP